MKTDAKRELERYQKYALYLEERNRKLEKEIKRVCSRSFKSLEPGVMCIGCVYCHTEDLTKFECRRPLRCYVEEMV